MPVTYCAGFVPAVPFLAEKNHSAASTLRSGRLLPQRKCRQARFEHALCPWARLRRGFPPAPMIPETLFDAEPMKDIDFQFFDFSKLRGKVVLALNVASEDAKSDANYKQLVDLLEKYYDSGLRILCFPSNWFGQKERCSPEEIKKFVVSNYSDKFCLFSKADVDWNQVFALGIKHFPGEIVWNFQGKFLFGVDGVPLDRFDLLTTWDYIEGRVQHALSGATAQSKGRDEEDGNEVSVGVEAKV